MQFRRNTEVFTRAGKKAGVVNRVVLDPDSKQVTHLVVEKGVLFTDDRVIPVKMVEQATENRVLLTIDDAGFDEFPPYEDAEYVMLNDYTAQKAREESSAQPLYWYPAVGGAWWAYHRSSSVPVPPFVLESELNIPEGTVAVKEGASVVAKDGGKLGNIESVFANSDDHRVTHILISQGLLFKEQRLLPSTWISMTMEEEVHLNVKSDFVRSLPEYRPAA